MFTVEMRFPYCVVLACVLFTAPSCGLRLMQHLNINLAKSSENSQQPQEKTLKTGNDEDEPKREQQNIHLRTQPPVEHLSKEIHKNGESSINLKHPTGDTVKGDLSTKSKLNTIEQTNPVQKSQEEKKTRPMSYSEMKGAFLKKSKSNVEKNGGKINSNANIKMLDKRNSGKPNDSVTAQIHANLHRTSRQESIKSIMYPQTNPKKYSLSSTTENLDNFLNLRNIPRSKGKYDIRHLDVEKLMDIVVPDATALVYKYLRDLPSVPLIYECKTGIVFPLFKILGGFNQINNEYGGGSIADIDNRGRSDLIIYLFKVLFRWLLGVRPPENKVKWLAKSVEHDLSMFALELPHMIDKDCEGDMDEVDQAQFNFHYNYLMTQDQLSKLRKSSKRNRTQKSQLKKRSHKP